MSGYFSYQPPPDDPHKGWYKRGYIPHFDAAGIYQVITYRLADSLPQPYYDKIQQMVETLDPNKRKSAERKLIEDQLHRGHGSCILTDTACASIVEENWKHFDGKRYHLISYVVMPNHVHLIIKMNENFSLDKILQSWRGYTSHKINELTGHQGRIWQRGSWDRFIRDNDHFQYALAYIKKNFENGGVRYM